LEFGRASFTIGKVTASPLNLAGPEAARSDTARPYPAACLHELVLAQAAETPERVAVADEHGRLTYGELADASSRLARHLRKLGAGDETLVGVCLERSTDLLVALLAIHQTGAAYVPVDPGYPAERQAYVLGDAAAPLVVTQSSLVERLPQTGARLVLLDGDRAEIEREPAEPLGLPASPEQLAYVIYTSGSTGKPKGVEIPHRALVNFLWTMRERPALGPDDVLVAVTTLSFDIAGLELYLPLVTGARVVVASSETASDPRRLSALLDSSGATVLQATPTTWRMLLDIGWRGRPGLKALCGGEALPAELAARLVECGLELWNMYGPTETTIWSTVARIESADQLPTIGTPIANTTVHVLDEGLAAVPAGAEGELCIGGDGLARGYRGRPDLTEERFVVMDGERIYRTGDLVRFSPDGAIEYLGRIDDQVKVRGFRVELGEIETTLARHPGVARAVAVAQQDEALGARLVAYVVPTGVPVTSAGLRRFVAQSLPDYMVPSVIVAVETLPLTPNGKIDRKALPPPPRERSDEQPYVEPRNDLERQLVAIWEDVLDLRPIGVHDDFFDLGATSIVAASLFARIQHDLGRGLPLGAIFRAPTVEALAGLIAEGGDAPGWTSLVAIQPHGSRLPFFCVHGGAGTILHLQQLARRLGDDQPFYGLQSRGLYGGAAPLRTVAAMADHYLAEIRTVQPQGPYRLGGYCFGSLVAYEMAQRLVAGGEEVSVLATFNGPSADWIRRYGWYGNQPGRRTGPPMRLSPPRRVVRRTKRRLVGLWVRLQLALGRDVPERIRERYFLWLHMYAEKVYFPEPYAGRLLSFFGAGLYDDPALGWGDLTEVAPHPVPGDHTNNRQIMSEPYVSTVADALAAALDAS
jgi:amino acid adenylation domain-containing protein